MKKPKWPRKEGKYFEIPLFGGNMWTFYTREHYEQALASAGCEPPDNLLKYGGLVMMIESEAFALIHLVGIFDHFADIVAHEAVHVAQHVMEEAGSKDNETAAYLTQAVFQHIFSNLPKEKQVES